MSLPCPRAAAAVEMWLECGGTEQVWFHAGAGGARPQRARWAWQGQGPSWQEGPWWPRQEGQGQARLWAEVRAHAHCAAVLCTSLANELHHQRHYCTSCKCALGMCWSADAHAQLGWGLLPGMVLADWIREPFELKCSN